MKRARGAAWRWWLAGAVVLGVAGLGAAQEAGSMLLRNDPNLVPTKPGLMGFAVAAGAGTYDAHCAACHGATGRGDRKRGVPDLTDRDWLYGSGRPSEIEQVIDFGIRAHNPRTQNLAAMPAYAQRVPYAAEPKIPPLTPPEARDVIEFLRQVEGRDADADAAKRGSAIYHGTGGCYDCHGQDAAGDTSIGAPNLSDDIWLYGDGSRASLFDTLAHGHAGVCPAWLGKLKPLAVRETALYVYALSHRRPASTSKAS